MSVPSRGLVKVFEMFVGNLEESAKCRLDGLPGQIFLQEASSKFPLDDKMERRTRNSL